MTDISQHIKNLNGDELNELVGALAWDVNFGCWTRPGLELIVWPLIRARATWVLYADLDFLHFANDKFGEDEVDRRFRSALQVRCSDAGAVGRWKFGDELVIILCDYDDRPSTDPAGFAQRFQRSLNDVELSATFGIASVRTYDLAANVQAAYMRVRRAKHKNERGSINHTGSLQWKWGTR